MSLLPRGDVSPHFFEEMHLPPQDALSQAPPSTRSLQVEEIAEAAALVALGGEWGDLASRAERPSFFSTWEWTQAWLESFQGSRRLVLLLVRSGGRLVGVVPLLEGRGRWLRGKPGLELAVNKHSPSAGLLCEGDPLPVLAAALDHLLRTRGRTGIYCPLVLAASPVAAAIRELGRSGRLKVLEKESRCSHRIRIETSWEGYLATRSKHAQKEWRRKRRRLAEAGEVEMRLVASPDALPRALDDVLAIESHSWKHDSGTSFLRESGVESFYSRLAEVCAARGWLRLHLLYLDGRPAAHCYAVVYGNELLALKTSFDQRLAHLSPGLALMLSLCENAFGDGLAAVDLLGHSDRWKTEMANEDHPHVDLCAFARGHLACEVSALVEERIKPALRRRLPRPFRERASRVLARLRTNG